MSGHFTSDFPESGAVDYTDQSTNLGEQAIAELRELAAERCAAAGVELRVPRFSLCTDNGVMIAAIGAQLIHEGAQPSGLGVGTDTQLDVEEPQLT